MTATYRPRTSSLARGRAPTVSFPTCEHTGPLSARRATAHHDALSEVSTCGDPAGSAVAVRAYADGCVVLALAGTFDDAALARLQELTVELRHRAPNELVVDLSQLEDRRTLLLRLLARLRVQCLVAGARVELHSPPPELAEWLGSAPVQQIVVVDGELPRRGRRTR